LSWASVCGHNTFFWQWLVFHAGILKHVGPFAACASMAMFQMLAEVIRAEELLCLVTLSKLVYMVKMFRAKLPSRRVSELLAAVATDVSAIAGHGRVECCFWAGERSAGPRMTSQVKGVLVALCFVLVFEAVGTISTTVLLFGLVQSGD
jgi:hypothetical protein